MLSDSVGLYFDSTGFKSQFETKAVDLKPVPGINNHFIPASAYWSDEGLLLYHDGRKVYNQQSELISDIGPVDQFYTISSIMVPLNEEGDSVGLFRTGFFRKLTYTVLKKDSTHNYKLLSSRDQDRLISPDTFTGKFAAIRHSNNRDWWVIQHEYNTNVFWVIPIQNGKLGIPQKIPVGQIHTTFEEVPSIVMGGQDGQINTNKTGTKIVLTGATGIIDVFHFDKCSGLLYNHLMVNKRRPKLFVAPAIGESGNNYGCSFSPNERFIYTSDPNNVIQYDLKNINNPRYFTDTIFDIERDYRNDRPWVWYHDPANVISQHYVGQNGKIYLFKFLTTPTGRKSPSPWDSSLAVIHEPDQKGRKNCRFEVNAIPIVNGYRMATGMYAPTYSDDEPLKANATLSDTVVCPGDSVRFFNNSCGQIAHLWDFGAEKDTALNPVKVFTQPGIYKIRLLLTTYRPAGITPLELSVRVKDCLKVETETQIIPTDTCGQLGVQFKIQLKQGKPDFIQWNFDDGNQSYEPNPYHWYRSAGTYIPKLTVNNNEDSFTKYFDKVTVEPCPEQTEDFKLYPNPNTGSFTVEYKPLNDTDLELFNVLGQRIARFSLPAHLKKHHLRLEAVSAGVYFYRLKSNQTGKLIIY